MKHEFKHKTSFLTAYREDGVYKIDRNSGCSYCIPVEVVENSNDWEEIKQEEYPVGTVIKYQKGKQGNDSNEGYLKTKDGWISINPKPVKLYYIEDVFNVILKPKK